MKNIYSFLLFLLFSFSLYAQNCNKNVFIKYDDRFNSTNDNIEFCKSTPVTISLTETFSSAKYQWYLNNQLLSNQENASLKVEKLVDIMLSLPRDYVLIGQMILMQNCLIIFHPISFLQLSEIEMMSFIERAILFAQKQVRYK